jgi:hypothetical protein
VHLLRKSIGHSSVFASGNGINFVGAINYCFNAHLNQPYTLGTLKYDWEFKSVHRPNHGLVHTLRTMAYVPFVVKYLKECYPKFAGDAVLNAIPVIQLGMLFFVAGRENEAGSRDDAVAYERFRHNSAKAYRNYLSLFSIPLSGFEQRVADAICNCEFETSAVHCVMRIAHDVDCLRCQIPTIYDAICSPFPKYISLVNTVKLRLLVLECTLVTGDRIFGDNANLRTYDPDRFVECSKNVQSCIDAIESAVYKAKISKKL